MIVTGYIPGKTDDARFFDTAILTRLCNLQSAKHKCDTSCYSIPIEDGGTQNGGRRMSFVQVDSRINSQERSDM
jgi:hypothetical protein